MDQDRLGQSSLIVEKDSVSLLSIVVSVGGRKRLDTVFVSGAVC